MKISDNDGYLRTNDIKSFTKERGRKMDDKSFASDILNKTIDKLNLQQDWFQEYTNIFKDLFQQNKYDNQEEIYKAIEQGVNKI